MIDQTFERIPIANIREVNYNVERDTKREEIANDGWKYWRRDGSGYIKTVDNRYVSFSAYSHEGDDILVKVTQ